MSCLYSGNLYAKVCVGKILRVHLYEREESIVIAYLIVCPLVFLAGLVDSIAGGGGLISLPGYLIAGVPAHMALGTNKMSSTIGTSISAGFRFCDPAHDDHCFAHCSLSCIKK